MFKVLINGSLRGSAPCLFIPVSFTDPAREPVSAAVPDDNPESQVPVEPAEAVQDTVALIPAAAPDSPETEAALPEAEATEEIEPVTADTEIEPVKRSFSNMFFLQGDNPWLNRYSYFGKSVALVNALIFTIIGSFISMIILRCSSFSTGTGWRRRPG
jgi:hypothetical protein